MGVLNRHRKTSDQAPDLVPWGHEAGKCFICGEDATGYWVGCGAIGICAGCAKETLPRLIADAVMGEYADAPRSLGVASAALETITASFWRGVAAAIHRAAGLTREEGDQRAQRLAAKAIALRGLKPNGRTPASPDF